MFGISLNRTRRTCNASLVPVCRPQQQSINPTKASSKPHKTNQAIEATRSRSQNELPEVPSSPPNPRAMQRCVILRIARRGRYPPNRGSIRSQCFPRASLVLAFYLRMLVNMLEQKPKSQPRPPRHAGPQFHESALLRLPAL